MTGSAITPSMLAPITAMVTDNVSVLVPIGIGVLGMMVGVSLIPRLIYKFL